MADPDLKVGGKEEGAGGFVSLALPAILPSIISSLPKITEIRGRGAGLPDPSPRPATPLKSLATHVEPSPSLCFRIPS